MLGQNKKKFVKKFIFITLALGATGILISAARTKSKQQTGLVHAKNVVLLIGDGMGLAQISAANYAQGNKTIFEEFPVIGFQKTFAADNLITDSAAGATALACGKKTSNNFIGLDLEEKPCKSILEEAEERGLATGLVATSSIVHATPASFIAHEISRNLYEPIAEAFLKTEIDLFIGGGKQFFDRRDMDERNLVDELKQKNYHVVDFLRTDLRKSAPDIKRNFAYFTADNQPLPASQGREYLPFAGKLAVNFLHQRSEKGFFLMLEGSQIDWSCHANQGVPLLDEMKDFTEAIREIMEWAKRDGETLVIVTADHETGGLAIEGGPGMKNLDLKFNTNGHTGVMVPVFAYGPGAELFRGIYDNTMIYFKMKEAFGFDHP